MNAKPSRDAERFGPGRPEHRRLGPAPTAAQSSTGSGSAETVSAVRVS